MKTYIMFASAVVHNVILIGLVFQQVLVVVMVDGFVATSSSSSTSSSLLRQLHRHNVDTLRYHFVDSCTLYATSKKISTTTSNIQIPPNLKILILPGFGNDASDYLRKGSLVDSLIEQGWSRDNIDVLRIVRSDWLQVFWKGVFDIQFWMANADPTRPAFRWYLEQMAQQIKELCDTNNNNNNNNNQEDNNSCGRHRVILIAHSAGGWLGRAALGFGSVEGNNGVVDFDKTTTISTTPPPPRGGGPPINLDHVVGLVSLGAPHLPPPSGVMDMTRGALRITHEQFPGAYHKTTTKDGIFYLTVIGLSIQGEKQQRQSPFESTTVQGFAYNSYDAVCGDGTTIGDGVVPYCAAHLDDAVQVNLDGVLHSINTPDNWYGSSKVIERWHNPMLQELRTSKKLLGVSNSNHGSGKNMLLEALTNVVENFRIT